MLGPSVGKRVDDRFRCNFRQGYGDRPSREPINRREQVFVPVGPGKRHQVDVNVVESFIRDDEITNRWRDVASDF